MIEIIVFISAFVAVLFTFNLTVSVANAVAGEKNVPVFSSMILASVGWATLATCFFLK